MESAAEKFEIHKSNDPFPSIAPALLSSADIIDYTQRTGMIDPFHKEKLKPASYEVRMQGLCRIWNKDGVLKDTYLCKEGDKFKLPPNSIAFIEVEPIFRLPDYIAIRFNLKITHVYRGLLLGTGPLIDPGFVGKIFIPLHNLTMNSYVFLFNDGLIWVEFTKTSEVRRNNNTLIEGSDQYVKDGVFKAFDESKTKKKLDDYLKKAADSRSIISSIPGALRESRESASKAEKSAEKARETNRNVGIAVVATVVIGIFATWIQMSALHVDLDLLQQAYMAIQKENSTMALENITLGQANVTLEQTSASIQQARDDTFSVLQELLSRESIDLENKIAQLRSENVGMREILEEQTSQILELKDKLGALEN